MQDPLVGAHVSTAGGLHRAVERALDVGCRSIQVFTKNSNQWAAAPLLEEHASSFRSAARKARLAPLVAHAAYLINLASADEAIRKRSVDALVDEIERCTAAGIPYLVLHPGSHGGSGVEAGLDLVARGLDAASARTPASRVKVLLESAAGQGACLGHRLEELAAIRRRVSVRSRVAYCLDTCHLHAAGYDLVSKSGFRRLMDEVHRHLGVANVKVLHANDSKKERGCRVDRHERIGHGAIGEKGFANVMNEEAFEKIPKLLETPKDTEGAYDREGLAALRRLAGYVTRSHNAERTTQNDRS